MTSTIEQEEVQEFQVGPNPQLVVDNVSGTIDIYVGEDNVVHVIATKHGSERKRESTTIETSQDGDRVVVRTRGNSSGLFGAVGGMCSVDYRIAVPVGCSVEAKSVSADVSVTGTMAPVSASTVSGNVQLDGMRGACTLSTVSGDAQARKIEGTLTLRTTSGDARVLESRLESLNASSVSGDVSVASPLVAGNEYFLDTTSGDLTLTIPGDTGATVQMKTVSGQVMSELPAQIIKSGRRHWQGRIGGGEANVELKSVSGDLRIIASSPPTTVEPPLSDSMNARSEDVTDILRLLEQGEIGVEDALERIKVRR